MAVTLTLSDTITFTQTLIKNQRLNVNNLQPGITFANIILQRMQGPPFVWRFNRATVSIAITNAGGTDYVQVLPSLGHIETQWLTDVSGKVFQLKGAVSIAKVNATKRPTEFAPVYDDNNGNITFRFNAIPDQSYTAVLDYQQKPQLITSFGSSWGNVSDEFAYIYNLGFLSMAGMLVNDARFPIWEKDFIAHLLGAQDGLDEQARNIFIGDWMNTTRTVVRSAGAVNAGIASRQQ